MLVRALCVLAVCLAPVAARAADEENPYKKAKVGDYAEYKMTTKVAGLNIEGTVLQTVTEKSDKEATIEVTGTVNFMGNKQDIPKQTQKIDLTKPYDPTTGGNIPGGGDIKAEKQKEGKEKIKVGGKEYDAVWTTYKVKTKAMGQEIDADMKVWTAKDVPAGMVKMSMNAKIAGQEMEIVMELTGTGSKK